MQCGKCLCRVAAAVLAAVLVAWSLTGTAVAAIPSRGGGHDVVRVVAPRAGTVLVSPTAAAARTTRLEARLRVTGGQLSSLTVRLNGHLLPGIARRSGTQRLTLDSHDGLRVGANQLWVSARRRGVAQPSVVSRRFVVGYRATGLLSSTRMQLGSGTDPAASLTLRAPLTGVHRVIATLNGKPVTLPAATPMLHQRRSYLLDLARLGARFGTNTFRLQLVMSNGRVQTLSRTFTLSLHRNIAVARQVGAAHVGHTVTLDASSSRLAKGHRPTAHWVLLSRPTGSHARLSSTSGGRISLRPDKPGHYRVGLRVGSGSRQGGDVVDVAATDPDPLVPFNTIDYSADPSTPSITVGGNSFRYQPNASLMLWALDRATLEPQAAYEFGNSSSEISRLDSTLSGLPATDLVIVTHPSGTPALSSSVLPQLNTTLQRIGGNLASQSIFPNGCWSGGTNYCEESSAHWTFQKYDGGSFSVIGVPGMPAGQAWRETATQNGTSNGTLTGYLTMGVTTSTGAADDYTVVPGPNPYETVNTCTDDGCGIQVGSHTYPADGSSGFHVLVLNRTTLAPIRNETVTTAADLETALSTSIPPDGQIIVPAKGVDDQNLVIIQSLDNAKLSGNPSPIVLADIDQLGGTPETFLSGVTGAHRYALVGAATDLPWHATDGLESSTLMPGGPTSGQPTGQISGEIQRGRDGLYTPVGGDPVGPTNNDLYSILYQPATAWPLAGDPALPYIANGIGLASYPDVRSAYMNLNVDFGTKATLLQGLTCSGQSFCGSDFDAVKAELLQEFDWVQSVKALAANLLAPYEQNGQAPYFDVQEITNEVLDGIPVPQSDDATMKWLNIVEQVVPIAGKVANAVKTANEVFGVIGTAGLLATQVMQTPDAGPADAVKAAADQLPDQMAHEQTAYVEWVSRMEGILLYDYGRLSAVGAAATTPSWARQPDTTIDAITSLDAGTRASAYSALLPIAWSGFDLKPGADLTGSDDVTAYYCDEPDNYPSHVTPFAGALPQNQFHALLEVSSSGEPVDEVWTFATTPLPWSLHDVAVTLPTGSVTDNIYGSTSTGPNGAYQYEPAWWRDTYDPPSHTTCQKGEGSMSVSESWSQAFAPPDITAPLP